MSENKEDQPNGCGPTWLPDIFPDGPDDRFRPACNEHDRLYKQGGGLKEKVDADIKLLKEASASVKDLPLHKRILGHLMAIIYFVAVLLFGGYKSFNWRK